MEDQVLADLARRTTEALTVIAENTKEMKEMNKTMNECMLKHNATTETKLDNLKGLMDNLKTTFVYVVLPLITGILALVGVKFIFNLP
jgi:hypothetical protein